MVIDAHDLARPIPGTALAEPAARYADVVVDVPTPGHSDGFTYSVPPGMALQPGHLVRVPFGKRNAHGIVLRLTDQPHVDYTKPIRSTVYPQPLLTPVQLELARWVSDYYRSSLFQALAPMLPPGFRRPTQMTIRLKADAHTDGAGPTRELPPGAQRLLTYLRGPRRTASLSRLSRSLGSWVLKAANSLVSAGLAETRWTEPTPPGQKGRAQLRPEPAQVTTPTQPPEIPLLPISAQTAALSEIRETLDNPEQRPRVFLLHGVTGSGKTEVYLQAIARCLTAGKRAIMLVPELSLTPQTVARFNARFPGQIGILHSGLTPAQQTGQWWRVLQGCYPIVIGARSAIFAPQRELGLIVIDEEHEWAYKQDDASPRYHSREVAERLAELSGAVVVLGSATPDVGDTFRAGSGRYRPLPLPYRIQPSGVAADLPQVEVVDMRQELRDGNRSVFSESLQSALRSCMDSGHQAILFLNRRGSAGVVQCRSCGFVMRCWRCASPYTYHREEGHGEEGLICHHCNRRRAVPTTCPQCRGDSIRYLGLGTQRVVEEVHRLLPGVRVVRWDSDSAKTGKEHQGLMDLWEHGKADVLVGTQMIAKGLHIPAVTLVGVVLADVGLHVPDFRAAERAFQLLCQVAGRAGRGSDPGQVIVQTYLPDFYAVRTGAQQDYAAFYGRELAFRKARRYPPATRLIRLLFADTDATASRKEALRMAGTLKRAAYEWDMRKVDVIGPAPAYPPRLRGRWRWHLLLRGDTPRLLLDKVDVPPNWVVDVDPLTVA